MKVVLNQDIKGLGKKLQVVEVSEGYARIFLLPKKLANIADNKSLNEAKTKKQAIAFKKDVELEEANKNKEKIEKIYIEFREKQGAGGKLFGSVTEKEIALRLKEKVGIDVNKKKISLKEPIKQLGNYVAEIKLYEGVIAKLKIVVVGV